MSEVMDVRAILETGMRFDVETGSEHHITLDASQQDGGQNTGPRPIEMILVGLAGCTGMDVISILRKKRQQVTEYEIKVHGIRAGQHPKVFTNITVEHIVTGYHVQPEAVARAIELSETRYCSVGATISGVSQITNTFRIIEAQAKATDTLTVTTS